MQSRKMVACRTLVMFTSLIAMPLLAIFGIPLPHEVVRLLPAEVRSLIPAKLVAPERSAAANPAAVPSHLADAQGPSRQAVHPKRQAPLTGMAPAARETSRFVPSAPTNVPPVDAVRQADYEAPLGGKLPAAKTSAYHAPIAPTAPPPATPDRVLAPAKRPADIAQPDADPFRAIQDRLRGLGATHYVLETWGRKGELFRFQCELAVQGDPSFRRHFEAVDDDPRQAMKQVLEQAERWRGPLAE